MVYITLNLVSEAEFDTKTWQGYLKKNRYMHGMLQQIRSIFFKLSLQKYTWPVNGLMTNTKFTSLKNSIGVSLYR